MQPLIFNDERPNETGTPQGASELKDVVGREELTEGNLWAYLRMVLCHGVAIQQDYEAGKYASYEHYSARVDAAAQERAEEFMSRFLTPNGAISGLSA